MKMKRLIALVLCLLLAVCLPVFGAAAEEDAPFYLVLGDSIGYGSGLSNPKEAVYGKIVADTNGYDYANDAIPGYTTTALLQLMQTEDVKADIEKADIISISIGGNNYLLGNMMKLMADVLVKGDDSGFAAIGEDYYADLCEIIGAIREWNPDAVILMQTLYNPQTGYTGEVYDHGTKWINDSVNRYAEEHPGEIEIVDVAARLTDHPADFAADRIHPSAAGNEKIAAAILEKLAELGLGDATEPVVNVPGRDAGIPGGPVNTMELFAKFLHFMSYVYNFFAKLSPR